MVAKVTEDLLKAIKGFQMFTLLNYNVPTYIENEDDTLYLIVPDFELYDSDEYSELAGKFTSSIREHGVDFSIIYDRDYENKD